MAVNPIPEGYHTVTPYLLAKDAAALLNFLKQALGAVVKSSHGSPDGKIMHAELRIGNSMLMLAEASEKWAPMPAMYYLYVEDVDSLYKQALAAGGVSLREPTNEYYGDRSAGIQDAHGNQWWMATHIEDVTPEEIERRQQQNTQGS
jgi:uncharacterized glyoxalase superfamily protein PhnB